VPELETLVENISRN